MDFFVEGVVGNLAQWLTATMTARSHRSRRTRRRTPGPATATLDPARTARAGGRRTGGTPARSATAGCATRRSRSPRCGGPAACAVRRRVIRVRTAPPGPAAAPACGLLRRGDRRDPDRCHRRRSRASTASSAARSTASCAGAGIDQLLLVGAGCETGVALDDALRERPGLRVPARRRRVRRRATPTSSPRARVQIEMSGGIFGAVGSTARRRSTAYAPEGDRA